MYICYLLLCDTSAAESNQCSFTQFWGSGICNWLSWLVLAQGAPWGCSQTLSRGHSQFEDGEGWKILSQAHLCGCEQTSVSHWLLTRGASHTPWGLARALLQQVGGFPPSEWPKKERAANREANVFYNIISEMTYHHFCHVPWSHTPALVPEGRGLHKHVRIEERIPGGHAGDWLALTPCSSKTFQQEKPRSAISMVLEWWSCGLQSSWATL